MAAVLDLLQADIEELRRSNIVLEEQGVVCISTRNLAYLPLWHTDECGWMTDWLCSTTTYRHLWFLTLADKEAIVFSTDGLG